MSDPPLLAAGEWVASHRPLGVLALTLGSYGLGHALWQRAGRHPALNPTLLGIAMVAGAVVALRLDYRRYFEDARLIHLLLGPAVVALAVPLYRQLPALRARASALAAALLTGSLTAILSVLGVAWWLGASRVTLLSLAPKSATTAVSMSVSAGIGGVPALTAVVTILGAIIGTLLAPPLLNALGLRDPIARGFGMGLASHGIATARAFQEGEATGSAAGLAMGLNAVLTAFLVPLLTRLLLPIGP